jgi:hypothetical protein
MVRKGLPRSRRLCFSAPMFSRNYLLRLPALFAIGLFAFSQTGLAEEPVVAELSDGDNELDETDEDDNSETRKRGSRPAGARSDEFVRAAEVAKAVTENGTRRLELGDGLSFGPVSQTAESEAVIVRGFYIDPPDYPALPEVEGTRINSGKKTSFVKPEQFPTVANNNYREVMATTPAFW